MIWVFCPCQWWVSKKTNVWMVGRLVGGWGQLYPIFFWIFWNCLTLQSLLSPQFPRFPPVRSLYPYLWGSFQCPGTWHCTRLWAGSPTTRHESPAIWSWARDLSPATPPGWHWWREYLRWRQIQLQRRTKKDRPVIHWWKGRSSNLKIKKSVIFSAHIIESTRCVTGNTNENGSFWVTVKLGDTLAFLVKPCCSCRTNSTTTFIFRMLQPCTLF